jgi:hypothetical protein
MSDRSVMSDSVARLVDGAPAAPAWGDIVDRRRRRQRRGRVVSAVAVVLVLVATVVVASLAGRPGRVTSGSSPALSPQLTMLPVGPLLSRKQPAGVWTGRELIVWGGLNLGGTWMADGAALDPATGTWRMLAPSPLSPRSGAVAVWTGTEVLVWGGGVNGRVSDDGARYDPVTDRWALLPPAPRDWNFGRAGAVWVDGRMVVGGSRWSPESHDGLLVYDSATGSWTPTELPSAVVALTVVGGRVAVLRAGRPPRGEPQFALFDPATGALTHPGPVPVPGEAERLGMVVDRGSLLLVTDDHHDGHHVYVHRFDPSLGQWTEVAETEGTVVLDGGARVTMGEVATYPLVATGGRLLALSSQGTSMFDPATGEFSETPQIGETKCLDPDSIEAWTGTEFVSWGQSPCDGSVLSFKVRPFA